MNVERVGLLALSAATALVLVILAVQHGVFRARASGPAAASGVVGTGRTAESIAALEARVAAKPDDAEGWVLLGRHDFAAERYGDAARAYARATAIAPVDAANWSALGEAIVLTNKAVTDDAAHAFHRALDVDPRDSRARYFLAVQRDLEGDHRGAIDAWIAVLRDSPPDAPWAGSIRALIEQVAIRNHIDVAGRLPKAVASPTKMNALDGEALATAAIPGPDGSQMAEAARLSPSDQDRMVQGMIERLAARLAANPQDAAGWIRLMRARAAYGDRAAARATVTQAHAAFAGDAATLRQFDLAAQALAIAP